ncbi:hypothetical protein GGR51DRAFT_514009 [Nemania sp. FL0031]|nr:hypothetical protein GGR51DRAFT_514009 [Nemania sp. FL0031]
MATDTPGVEYTYVATWSCLSTILTTWILGSSASVTKFQVSGLARIGSSGGRAGTKSQRTIVVEPGGPGVSGTPQVWNDAETVTKRFSDSQFDVLG